MRATCKHLTSVFFILTLSVLVSLSCAAFAFADASSDEEETWTKIDTCEWRFDEASGVLTIRPYQNASSGYIDNTQTSPWSKFSKEITVVEFEGDISLQGECNYLFSGFTNLREFRGLDTLDTSKATSLKSFFHNCSSIKSLDISGWNTSNVTSFLDLFSMCSSLESLNLSRWDTSNVTTMNSTFDGCTSLVSLNLNGWDTSKVTSFYFMFRNCRTIKSLNISHFDYSSANIIQMMFNGCSSLESIVFSSRNNEAETSDVCFFGSHYNLQYLFGDCTSLSYVDLSGISAPADSTAQPFKGCTSLVRVKIGPEFNARVAFPLGYWSNEQGECFEDFEIPLNTAGAYIYKGTVKEIILPANSVTKELSEGRYKIPVSFVSRGMQDADISWSSSNPEVASVDTSGVVRPYKTGKTTITICADRVSTSFDIVFVDTPKQTEDSVGHLPEQVIDPITSVTPIKTIVPKPSIALKSVSIKKLTKLHKGFTIKWSILSSKYLKQINGYKIRYSTSKSMKKSKTKTVKASSTKGKKRTLKVTKLKTKKKYYLQVATYKIVDGKLYLSKWSKVKSIKTK